MSTRRVIIPPLFSHDILNSVLSEKPPAILYHYTTQKGLLGIVQSKKIWATHHQCLNDTQEYLHAKNLVRQELAERCRIATPDALSLLEEMRSILDGPGNEDVNLYVASFSQEGDSLSQWRAYCGQTSGFALGFRSDLLVLPERFTITRCIYETEKQREVVKALISEVLGRPQITAGGPSNAKLLAVTSLLMELHRFALIFKHDKFKEEREWRVVSPVLMDFAPRFPVPDEETKLEFREGRSMLTPYRSLPLGDKGSLPLSEVVVGPNPNPTEQSERSVRSLLNSERGLEKVPVYSSKIPYRNW